MKQSKSKIRIRNRETRNIKRKFLLPDPLNWHTHPDAQHNALAALFRDVGFVGHLLVRPAGQRNRFYIVDGHERAEHFGPDESVPCCVLDVDETEARKLLLAYDPLGYLGGVDQQQLDKLTAEVRFDDGELDGIINGVLSSIDDQEPGGSDQNSGEEQTTGKRSRSKSKTGDEQQELPDMWEILIECQNEQQQLELLEDLNSKGYACRAFTA